MDQPRASESFFFGRSALALGGSRTLLVSCRAAFALERGLLTRSIVLGSSSTGRRRGRFRLPAFCAPARPPGPQSDVLPSCAPRLSSGDGGAPAVPAQAARAKPGRAGSALHPGRPELGSRLSRCCHPLPAGERRAPWAAVTSAQNPRRPVPAESAPTARSQKLRQAVSPGLLERLTRIGPPVTAAGTRKACVLVALGQKNANTTLL